MCFFFSSRRRHTRCSRDWSSDVCSSDLAIRATRSLRRRGRAATVAQGGRVPGRSEEHTSELQSRLHLVCRLLLEKKKMELLLSRYWLKYHNATLCAVHLHLIRLSATASL